MTVRISGIHQPSIWASVVSDQALVLRDWLLGLGFTEDLLIPETKTGSSTTVNWTGLRAVAFCSPAPASGAHPVGQG